METNFIEGQKSEKPSTHQLESLYESNDSRLSERGDYDGHVAESSLYTTASLHPGVVASTAALALGAGLAYSLYKRSQTH